MSLFTKGQSRAARKLLRNQGGVVWRRVGTGKTRIALKVFATIAKHCRHVPTFLVVCRRAAFDDWRAEPTKIGFDCITPDYELYNGNNRTRLPRILLLSHGMLGKLSDEIESISSSIEMVCFDEGFLFKNPSSEKCKTAHKLSLAIGRACILSGSVMTARNLEDVYGQLKAVAKESVLGKTLTDFRSKFMGHLWIEGANQSFPRFYSRRGATERISRLVSPFTSVYFPKSTRKIERIKRNITGLPIQRDFIERLKREYYIKVEGMEALDIKNAANLITKVQQISDGFLKSKHKRIEFPSAKMEYLLGKLDELLDAGEQVVVWCAFRHTVKMILQRLQKLKIKAYGLIGGSKFQRDSWQRDGQVCVATEDCGSSVNFLGQVQHAIYYSMSVKWLALQQSEGRTDRKDSRHDTCIYEFLFLQGSLDRFVYNTARNSGREEKKLIDMTQLQQWLNPIQTA